MQVPQAIDVCETHQRIKPYVHQTPVLTSQSINEILGCELFFKCENFQKVGAFKYRGATNAVLSLSAAQKSRGVATHSSGNHAAALALAAKLNGVKAHIVMPNNAPDIKKKAVAGYGADITFCEPALEAREATLKQIIGQTGATMVHPYNQWEVICGQGTAALELLERQESLDVVMTPVGGGGLLSGTAIYVKEQFPHVKVMAGEPIMADDAFRSFKSGKFCPVVNPATMADGLRTSLGSLTFQIIQNKVDDILVVQEESIRVAMRLVWERMKIIIEPSSAVPLAAIMENEKVFANKRIGIILSGGNVDLNNLPF